jgi:hypothetical protein
MKSFDELESQSLRWVQKSTAFKYNWELQTDDGEIIASMRQKSMWSYEFDLDAVGQRWEFENKGILGQRIEIRSVGTGDLVATHYMLKNRLEFASGKHYHWKHGDLWGMKCGWVDDDEKPIVGFQAEGFLKWESNVLMHPEANATKSLSLLVFFGWYLMVMYYMGTSA